MLGQPRKYGRHKKKLHQRPLRGSYGPLKSSRYCPVPRATVQFPRATVQFPRATVQFLMLLSSSSRYCPVPRAIVQFPRATVQSLFFFFCLPKAGYIFVFFFRQTIHPSIPVYLFFQIHTFFPIFWAHTHHARFDFLALLSSSSRYCPVPRAIVQFLLLLCSSSRYCAVSSRYCLVCSHWTIARGDWTIARGTGQ